LKWIRGKNGANMFKREFLKWIWKKWRQYVQTRIFEVNLEKMAPKCSNANFWSESGKNGAKMFKREFFKRGKNGANMFECKFFKRGKNGANMFKREFAVTFIRNVLRHLHISVINKFHFKHVSKWILYGVLNPYWSQFL
jgi:hypothetical protein